MSLFQMFLAWVGSLFGHHPRDPKIELEMAQFRQREAARKEDHRNRIVAAIPLLTGTSWRDPVGKAEFVTQVYEGIPSYLWYALGGTQSVPREEALLRFFWGERGPSFGDFELHRSEFQEIGTVLRIRNPEQFAAEVTIGGVVYPLCQTGYRDPWGGTDREPMVSFVKVYDELTCPG